MSNFLKNLKIGRRLMAFFAEKHIFGDPSAKLKIVGVTGTSGKTTTATLLYRIATALGYKAGLIGTVENMIAGERVATPENKAQTTPDTIFLHKLLNQMVTAGCEYVFMEVSSHALDQDRVAGIKFTGGIFTNLTQDHFDYHKNFENYFQAKKKFFAMLPPESFAISNTDDPYGYRMLEGINARKFSLGFNKALDFRGEIYKSNFNGLELYFNDTKIKAKLLGKFNAYNLLSVWSACKLLGFDMAKVNKIVEDIKPPRGRFEHFTSPSGVLVVVDYAHKPDAVEKVLAAVKETKTTHGRIISLLGCGGNKDLSKRPIMGKIAATLSDISIFTSDNPRNEEPEDIIAMMKTDLSPELLQKVKSIPSRYEAIREAVELAESGDIIIAMGKGHEDYQEIKGVRTHFDDLEEFKKLYQV